MKRIAVIALILSIISMFSGCQKPETNEKDDGGGKSVKTMLTDLKTTDQVAAYSGVIQPVEKTDLSFNIPGRITQIHVAEGDVVAPGQILASIDTQDVRMQKEGLASKLQSSTKEIKKAEDSLRFNEEDYIRNKTLFEAGAISEVALDQKKLAYEQSGLVYQMTQDAARQLQTEQKRLQSIIEYGTLVAENKGVVEAILLEDSEYAAPGKPVLTLRSEKLFAVAYVSASDLKAISPETKVSIEQDGKSVNGRIATISAAADDMTHAYRVEIAIPDGWGSTGSIIMVRFVTGDSEKVWIPLQSILSSTVDYVYVVKDGKAVKRVIEIIETNGDEVGVSGLEPGQKVIVSGMKSIIEGMTVKESK